MVRTIAFFAVLTGLAGCADRTPEPRHLRGTTMGVVDWNVKVAELPDGLDRETLQERIDARLAGLNGHLSNWEAESDVSRFNRHDGVDWFSVAPEVAAVVAESLEVSRATGGAFDVTVAPLVNLWSFGEQARPERIPSEDEIAAARDHVGWEKLEARLDPPALRKSDPTLTVNLSAIAKGYVVDEIAELLAEADVSGAMVEIGGEIRTRGTRPGGEPWRLGVETPTHDRRGVQRVLELRDRALATSGDYRNYFERDGQRYSHTIDPTTGRPIEHTLASVSVLADDCATADAWATALMVLGPDEAYNSAVERGLSVLFLVRAGDGFVERETPAFTAEFESEAKSEFPVETLLITFAAFLVVIAAMSVGVLLGRGRIKGSCGGLANFRDREGNPMCDACSKPSETCEGVEEGRARERETAEH